ncbi:biotin--[acetyl-CoA-carboxylase] ligase [Rubrivivax gelatinosus]|uniref:biotin--[biotin carboxyl-carrier protein] ligase n=1 Tax=Rubrivivax gelatinosus (strain NBRC 100245 / IL144) TaxID=983917 RepID=I0HXS3_RUBGI|nr:biotin--[acetyl-CoA-carboxylase] ligase [Rubrivivax gelatinosus]BAL97810.1 biotin--acetyl-CoA-carboxylase ligase [Rubrivivax gelatinosus IL144]
MDAPVPTPFHAGQAEPLRWGAEEVWQQLQPLLPGVSVEVVASTDSTNTRLIERARAQAGQRDAPVTRPGELRGFGDLPRAPYGRRAGDTEPCLLVAEHQTGGRGRLGRDWLGAAGASLTFSLSLPLAPRDWSGLSLAVGVALAEALDVAPPRIGLKWPNDLWILDGPGRGRKLGGILIETVPVGQRRMCIVGVGLNVLPQPAEGLTHGYACLQELDGEASAPRALAAVAAPLVQALLRFEAQGFAAFQAGFERRDLLAGLPVTTTGPEPLHGVAEGVDERGALRVRAGTLHTLVSGEVSVRLRDDTC